MPPATVVTAALPVTPIEPPARDRIISLFTDRYGTHCFAGTYVDVDWEALVDAVTDAAAGVTGGPILDGRAFVGSLQDAARAFGAIEIFDSGERPWILVPYEDDQVGVEPLPSGRVPNEKNLVARRLDRIPLKGGAVAWHQTYEYVLAKTEAHCEARGD